MATQTDPWGLTLTYGYDANGNKTSVTDSLGGTTTSTYSSDNQLTSRSYNGPEVSSPISVGLNYNAAGQLTNLARYSGTATVATTQYGYDLAGDTTSIVSENGSGNTIADYGYNYGQSTGAVGGAPSVGSSPLSPSQISDLLFSETDNGVATNYGYDSQNELTSAGSTTESYDGDGNRTNPGYVTGVDNRLLTDGTWNYTYDAAGNTTQKVNIATGETWTYGYDFNNKMTSAVDTSANGTVLQSIAYQYDVFGNRVQEDVTQGGATTTTRFAYDGQNAWATLDGNNTLQMRYLYLAGADQPTAQISAAGAVGWYLTDHLGSVRDVVNNSGAVVDHIDYDAFGNVARETNPSQAPRFGWAGGVRDMQTGLYYFDNRYYNPQIARWTTKDPSGLRAGDVNEYRYVGNNVTNATDPTGLFSAGGAVGSGLVGAGTGALVGAYIGAPFFGVGAAPAAVVGGLLGGAIGFVAGGWFSQDVATTTGMEQAAPTGQGDFWTEFFVGMGIGVPSGIAGGLGGAGAVWLWTIYAPASLYGGGGAWLVGGGSPGAAAGATTATVQVTSWAEQGKIPDLNPGRWVQLGGPTYSNWLKTGLWGGKFDITTSFPWMTWTSANPDPTNFITDFIEQSTLLWPNELLALCV